MPDTRFYELWEPPQADSNGVARRTFRVPIDSEIEAVRYNQTDPAMPKEGDPHPRDPQLVCNRITTAGRLGTDSWQVVAEYGYPGFTSSPSPPPDKTKPYVKWLSGGFSFREVEVPYFHLYPFQVVTSGTGPIVTKTAFEAKPPLKYPVRQAVYQKTVTVPDLSEADALVLFNETNKIHTIGAKRYLFTGATFDQESVNGFTIRYEWVYEQDTDLTNFLAPLASGVEYSVLPLVSGKRILPAYHGFLVKQTSIPDIPIGTFSVVPLIQTAPMYVENPGGATTLPGSPVT